MIRTISIPVEISTSLVFPLMEMCAVVFNKHIEWASTNNTYNKSKAHNSLYHKLREEFPELPSALIQAVRDSAMESFKVWKTNTKKWNEKIKRVQKENESRKRKKRLPKKPRLPEAKKYSSIRYDKRTSSFRGTQLTLASLGKRFKVILDIPDYFKPLLDWDFKGVRLCYERSKKRFWVKLIFAINSPDKCVSEILSGVDRGIFNLATLSTGENFSSKNIRASQRKYLYNRKTLQTKGTPSAKRRLKKMSGKEKRFSRDVNHVVTKQIVYTSGTTFVLEDLSGIRDENKGKIMNKWLGGWSFDEFQFFLEYKAEMLGKEVVYVDPRYTSQKCSQCKNIDRKNRNKSRFKCKKCRFECHSDLNASYNIRDNYLLSLLSTGTEEQGAVNRPDVSTTG